MYVEKGVFTGGRQDWPGPEHGQEAGRGVLEHVTPSDRKAFFQYHWGCMLAKLANLILTRFKYCWAEES